MSMTKSEAIKFLSRYVGNDYYTPQCQQAHRMAIEAIRERERVTMNTREKLVVLLDRFVDDEWFTSEEIADELIAHGVTVQECARPIEEWGEDYGDVLWWKFPIDEPPYVGSPLDAAWPGYHTHWTPIAIPQAPKENEK